MQIYSEAQVICTVYRRADKREREHGDPLLRAISTGTSCLPIVWKQELWPAALACEPSHFKAFIMASFNFQVWWRSRSRHYERSWRLWYKHHNAEFLQSAGVPNVASTTGRDGRVFLRFFRWSEEGLGKLFASRIWKIYVTPIHRHWQVIMFQNTCVQKPLYLRADS